MVPERDMWVRLTYLSMDPLGEVNGVSTEDVWHLARSCELGPDCVSFEDADGMFYVPVAFILELTPLPPLP